MNLANQRLFLAFPADEIAEPLSQLQDQLVWPGRRISAGQFHLTLRFLGALTPAQADSLLRQLTQLTLPAFSLRLDQLGFFPKAQVLWLGPSQVPTPLSELYQELLLRCGSLGLAKPHKAYRPHISLYRNAPLPSPLIISPLHFCPRDLALYSSTSSASGTHYQVLARWPLTH